MRGEDILDLGQGNPRRCGTSVLQDRQPILQSMGLSEQSLDHAVDLEARCSGLERKLAFILLVLPCGSGESHWPQACPTHCSRVKPPRLRWTVYRQPCGGRRQGARHPFQDSASRMRPYRSVRVSAARLKGECVLEWASVYDGWIS